MACTYPRAYMALWLPTLFLTSGCASVYMASGPSLDSGTVEVSGVETGTGGHFEVGFQNERDGSGVGAYVSLGLLGYDSPGDGDPIFQTILEARYRHLWGTSAQMIRPYYSLGAGTGVVYVARPRSGSLMLHGELGGQLSLGRTMVSLSLRERPALLIGRAPDFLNSLQVFLGIGLGVGD